MIELGTKVSLEISEPWPIYKVLTGTVVRSLNSGQFFIIRVHESNELYLVANRYQGERLSDIEKGSIVTVGIATSLPEFDLLAISDISPDDFKRLNYIYIGNMKKLPIASD